MPDFITIYNANVTRIYRYHLARTGSSADAEDLTAETFRAALESFARFASSEGAADEGAAAWLAGIARHKLADYFRAAGRPDGAGRALGLEMLEGAPHPAPRVEDAAFRRLDLESASAALRAMRPERAEALALHYFAGLTMAEVGQAMNRSEEAAKKLVQRGLAEIKALLAAPA